MDGKWKGKYGPEMWIILAAWLVFGWPRPAFPASQLAAADPMTPPYSPRPGTVSTGIGRAEETAPAAPAGESPSSLRFAPVQYWGNIGYELRRETVDEKEYLLQSLTAKVNVSTFIWQPWFAQVGGGLGITTSATSTAETADGKGANNFFTGNAALNLLPYSRFPFEAHFDRSDSRLNTGLGAVTSAYQTTRFGLSQRYRTAAGDTQYLASYDRNLWESADFGTDKQDILRLEMTRRLANQVFQINGDFTRNDRPRTNESTLLNTLVARHGYTPGTTLSVESLASLTRTNYRLTQGESDFRYLQLSSFAFWRPTGEPLTVTGSVRLFGINSDSNSAVPSLVRGASANLGGVYELTRHMRLNGSINVNMTDNNGTQTVASNQSAGLTYQSDAISLGAFRYTGFASGTVTNRTDPTDSGQRLTLQLGHSLNRSMGLGSGTLGLNVSQMASSDMDSRLPSVLRLSHSGSLTWSRAEGQTSTFLRLSASDSRAVSGAQDFFQLLNLQASRNENLSRNASWGGNLTIQAVRQSTGTMPVATYTTSSADLNYRHQRAFGVPRLRFVSELRIYGDTLLPLLASPEQQESRSWENRLDYSIGRTQLRLSARISEINKKQYSLLMFTLNRQFGGL